MLAIRLVPAATSLSQLRRGIIQQNRQIFNACFLDRRTVLTTGRRHAFSTLSVKDSQGLSNYTALGVNERKSILFSGKVPNGETIFRYLSENKGSLQLALALRSDVLDTIGVVMKGGELSSMASDSALSPIEQKRKMLEYLKELDDALKRWISAAFSPDNLELGWITFEGTSGQVLEKIARGETVHSVRSLSELKKRLGPGRRCFALFHKGLEKEPLAFIHVALTNEIPSTLSSINELKEDPPKPTHAIFYSVNSLLSALAGIGVATRLIKMAAAAVRESHPSVQTFSTLSPMPGFVKWLHTTVQRHEATLLHALPLQHKLTLEMATLRYLGSHGCVSAQCADDIKPLKWLAATMNYPYVDDIPWTSNTEVAELLREPLMWLACHYIANEKLQNLPRDPVARFHLRNGASFHRMNWLANPTSKGLHGYSGMMVNYLYDLNELEKRAMDFEENNQIHIGEMVKKILDVPPLKQ